MIKIPKARLHSIVVPHKCCLCLDELPTSSLRVLETRWSGRGLVLRSLPALMVLGVGASFGESQHGEIIKLLGVLAVVAAYIIIIGGLVGLPFQPLNLPGRFGGGLLDLLLTRIGFILRVDLPICRRHNIIISRWRWICIVGIIVWLGASSLFALDESDKGLAGGIFFCGWVGLTINFSKWVWPRFQPVAIMRKKGNVQLVFGNPEYEKLVAEANVLKSA